jgi:hypothetical protein
LNKLRKVLIFAGTNQYCFISLDTDWYEPTKHELIHLFPILLVSGVLIPDDSGQWAGSKKAVTNTFLKTRFF